MIGRIDIPVLETERLILRGPEAGDLPAVYAFYDSARSSFVGGPMSHELAWRQLGMEIGHWALRGYGRWTVVEKATGAVAGMVGIFNPEGWPEAEIGWDLFDGFEGRGYATEAAIATRGFAYDTLGMTTIISLVKPANEASAAVARRMGALKEGTFTHERHGTMDVWRHLSPKQLKEMAA